MARMTVEEIYKGEKYDAISATALQTNAYGKRTPKMCMRTQERNARKNSSK